MSNTNRTRANPCNGGSFDDFLKEQRIFEAVQLTAVRRTIATQIAEVMRKRNLTKIEMARTMRMDPASLDRLLDPDNGGASTATLRRAVIVVGRESRLKR